MEKENHKIFYKCLKPILGAVFYIKYRPKLVNKDLIPKEGPIVVCGNHIHILDQCLPILSTKRMLHYMAKKEYFDGKAAWFFKASGCISVNRQIHDDDAKAKAIDVLSSGYGLGIYPEGTRNQIICKEERLNALYKLYENEMEYKKFCKVIKNNQVRVSQIDKLEELKSLKKISDEEFKISVLDSNKYLKKLVKDSIITFDEYKDTLLMKTKFGTVSMAQKTGATIVPYAITGKYKFIGGHLKCTFLTPFKVGKDDDLEDANNRLRNEIIEVLAKYN